MQHHYIPKNPRPKKVYSLCRLCKAKIFWTVTQHLKKNIPVDYDPKIEYLFDGISKVYFDFATMKSHWASCPYASHFRK